MLICDHCRQEIDMNKEFLLIRSTYCPEDGHKYRKMTGLSYHHKCFNKIFIFRDERGNIEDSVYRRPCTCGYFADYRYNGNRYIDVKYIGELTMVELGNNHYYHRDHFLKFWNGNEVKKAEEI